MSEQFTPSTDQVRSHYVFDQSDRWAAERGDNFDRWLAAHDREVKAEAWDECVEAMAWAQQNGPEENALAYVGNNNPYRIESEARP